MNYLGALLRRGAVFLINDWRPKVMGCLTSRRCQPLALALVISVGALGVSDAVVAAATMEQAAAACDAATAARKSAAAVGMEWRDTKKMIKAANEKIESGDYDAAVATCEAAKFQGETGVKQAEIESKTWMSRVPK
jgi:hypothetical protein